MQINRIINELINGINNISEREYNDDLAIVVVPINPVKLK